MKGKWKRYLSEKKQKSKVYHERRNPALITRHHSQKKNNTLSSKRFHIRPKLVRCPVSYNALHVFFFLPSRYVEKSVRLIADIGTRPPWRPRAPGTLRSIPTLVTFDP